MASTILVTGGTGTLGAHVVPRLTATGRPVRVLSRHRHDDTDRVTYAAADLSSGEGVDSAVSGVETVVHLAGSARGDGEKARHLVRAARRAGVRHIVYISVVGAERVPVVSAVDRAMFGYFATKRAAERAVAESGIGWTTLRATQFHDLVFTTVQGMAKLPVVPVPSGVRFQPVETAEVADRLVELALSPPAGLVPELAGPTVYELAALVRSYLTASRRRRLLLPVRLPGRAAAAVRAGANLSLERPVGRRSWEEFLAERLGESPWFAGSEGGDVVDQPG